MNKATITRGESTDMGTFGIMLCTRSDGSTLQLITTELPDRDNEKQFSRIPEGVYNCARAFSPRFKKVFYRLEGVEGRSGVLIHGGNYAGDTKLGYISHSYGCILPARGTAIIGKQKGGFMSQIAVSDINKFFSNQPFELTIE